MAKINSRFSKKPTYKVIFGEVNNGNRAAMQAWYDITLNNTSEGCFWATSAGVFTISHTNKTFTLVSHEDCVPDGEYDATALRAAMLRDIPLYTGYAVVIAASDPASN